MKLLSVLSIVHLRAHVLGNPHLLASCSLSSSALADCLGPAKRWSPRGPSPVVFQPWRYFVEIMSRLYPVLSLVVIVVLLGRKGMLSVVAMMD